MPVTDPAAAELWTNLGVMAAAGIAVLAGYSGKKIFGTGTTPPSTSTVATVAGVGFELGNRQQIDLLIAAVNRVADAIEGKKLAGIEAEIKRLVGEVDEIGDEQRWQRPP